MSIEVGIVSYTPSTGDVDITTTALNGVTPKLAIFMTQRSGTLGVEATDLHLALGCADGTNQWCIGNHVNGGDATSLAFRLFKNSICAGRQDATNWHEEATFVKFLSTTDTGGSDTGVRINHASGASWKSICILIGGDDFSVDVGTASLGNQNVTTNVTAPGFRSQLTLICTDSNTVNHAPANEGNWSVGFASNDGTTIDQRALIRTVRHAVGTAEDLAYLHTSRVIGHMTTTALNWTAELEDNANGFDLTVRDANSGDDVGYIAMAFANHDVVVDTMTTPTSTGDDAQTGLGFEPLFVGFISSMMSAANTLKTDGEAGSIGMSWIAETEEACAEATSEDGVTTTNTGSYVNTVAVDMLDHDGTPGFVGTLSSFDADGHTVNYTTVDGSARLWPRFAVGLSPSGRIMGSLAGQGGLAGPGGIAGQGGGLAG